VSLDIKMMKMGVAVVDVHSCIAFWGLQCDACYRACPLLDEAIKLVYNRNSRTGKHALISNFKKNHSNWLVISIFCR